MKEESYLNWIKNTSKGLYVQDIQEQDMQRAEFWCFVSSHVKLESWHKFFFKSNILFTSVSVAGAYSPVMYSSNVSVRRFIKKTLNY